MKRLFAAALMLGASLSHAQPSAASAAASAPSSSVKKELVQKILTLQQPSIEGIARSLVEQPAIGMMRAAGQALQDVSADKRSVAGKAVEADIKKYVEDTAPIVRERAMKLAPSTIGAALEEKFTEDELRQLITMFESPINRKYAQLGPEIQSGFAQKLFADARPLVEPRLQALETKVRASLGVDAAATPPARASAPRKAASK